ncbi:hypothetical protein CEQ90_15085 [Lewinellaceae bacterium SD302]|nr:hypothetical protein CEQ90_15085 [Lewinellaceae bacterium SD302]
MGQDDDRARLFTETPFYRILLEYRELRFTGNDINDWLRENQFPVSPYEQYLVPVGILSGLQGFHLMAPKETVEQEFLQRLYEHYLFEFGANLIEQMQIWLAEYFSITTLATYEQEHQLVTDIIRAIAHWLQPLKVKVRSLTTGETLLDDKASFLDSLRRAPKIEFQVSGSADYGISFELPIYRNGHPKLDDDLADCQYFKMRTEILKGILKGETEALLIRYKQCLLPMGQLRDIEEVLQRNAESPIHYLKAETDAAGSKVPASIAKNTLRPSPNPVLASGENSIVFDKKERRWSLTFNGKKIVENHPRGYSAGILYLALLIEIAELIRTDKLRPDLRAICQESYFVYRYLLDGSGKGKQGYAGSKASSEKGGPQIWYASLNPEDHRRYRDELTEEATIYLTQMMEKIRALKSKPRSRRRFTDSNHRLEWYNELRDIYYLKFLVLKLSKKSDNSYREANDYYKVARVIFNDEFATLPVKKTDEGKFRKWSENKAKKELIPKDWLEASTYSGYAYYHARHENLKTVRSVIDSFLLNKVMPVDVAAYDYFDATIARNTIKSPGKVISFNAQDAPEGYRDLNWHIDIPTHRAYFQREHEYDEQQHDF